MSYIAAAQRYYSSRSFSPKEHSANQNHKNMVRYGGSHATTPMKQASFGRQVDTYIPSHAYPTATQASYDDGFRRDRESGREDRWHQPGYGGYEQAGYQQAFYGGGHQASPYEEAAYQAPRYRQQYGWQQAGAGYQREQQQRGYTSSWHPATQYQPLYSTTSQDQTFQQQYYGEQQQYAPFYFQPQLYQQQAQYAYLSQQPGLTQQWQAANNALHLPPTDTSQAQYFNASAPVFTPPQPLKSVRAPDLNRGYRVDKKTRYPEAKFNPNFTPLNPSMAGVNVPPLPPTLSPTPPPPPPPSRSPQAGQSPIPWRTRIDEVNSSTPRSPREPTQYLLQRPVPSSQYLDQADREPETMNSARPLLVVLDLNGTLIYRPNKGSNFVARPKVNEFLHYLLNNHNVMIWSSAKPKNVERMCDKLFTTEQKDQVVAIWSRDRLRLPEGAYNQKVQVYKQLTWIWKDKKIQSANPNPVDFWSQENTVLIDDSVEKAASEPHNIIRIQEFEGRRDQMESDVLGQVVKYLETLRSEVDVSAYMRWEPFEFDPEEAFDWTAIVNDMH